MLTTVEKKIPIDNSNFFFFKIEIKENEYIDILFDWKKINNIENLYFILKSYLISKEILIKNIFIIASNEDFIKNKINSKFFRNFNIKKIDKMTFFDFKIFYEDMFQNDWEYYLNNYELYGIRFIFLKESNIWLTKKFYPNYPWNINFKKRFIRNSDNIINKLIKENYILKKKLKYSVYKNAYKRRN